MLHKETEKFLKHEDLKADNQRDIEYAISVLSFDRLGSLNTDFEESKHLILQDLIVNYTRSYRFTR